MNKNQEYEDGFSLSQILRIGWKRRKLILISTLCIAIVTSVLILSSTAEYTTKLNISISDVSKIDSPPDPDTGKPATGLSLEEFNNFFQLARNAGRLGTFSKFNDFGFPPDVQIKNLWTLIPDYSNRNKSKGESFKFVTGFVLVVKGDSQVEARKRALHIAGYLKCVLVNSKIKEVLHGLVSRLNYSKAANNNILLRLQMEIKDLEDKEKFIKEELLSIPSSSVLEGSSVTELNKVVERYMSPNQQLVAVKMAIKEKKLRIDGLERRNMTSDALQKYWDQVQPLFDIRKQYMIEKGFLERFWIKSRDFFKNNEEQSKESIHYKEAYFWTEMRLTKLQKLQNADFRVLSETYPFAGSFFFGRWPLVVFVAIFIGFLISLLSAVAVEWWENNKNEITRDETK